ncbi:MAG: polysaccharide deacetylase family protein [Acidimicrobiales bacterium]
MAGLVQTWQRRRQPVVLNYHGVAKVPLEQDYFRLFVAPEQLSRDIGLLRRWGYEIVTFASLARQVAAGAGPGAGSRGLAALTFDDGFADNLTALVPVLESFSAPATVFVISGMLGEQHPDVPEARLLTAEEVRELARRGVEIGSHSTRHADLSLLSADDARDDLLCSRRHLEELLDAPVEIAAYPFGKATEQTARACREAGFTAACMTGGEGMWSDPMRLPRQAMRNGTTVAGVWLKSHPRLSRRLGPVVSSAPSSWLASVVAAASGRRRA